MKRQRSDVIDASGSDFFSFLMIKEGNKHELRFMLLGRNGNERKKM